VELERLRAQAAGDPDVAGLVVSGSYARDLATARSDIDAYVILSAPGRDWSPSRGAGLDLAVMSVDQLADVSDRWQRYAYRGARVVLDRLDGRIGALVEAQATLRPAEADALVREQLDGYVNFAYRAAKNRRDGHDDLARLEEIEAAPWFLWTLFALFGRVRPYNKYLRWELENYPLPAPWTAGHLITSLTDRPSALFADLEPEARARGFGDVLDAWGDDLELVRR